MRYFFTLVLTGVFIASALPAIGQTTEPVEPSQKEDTLKKDNPEQEKPSEDELDAFFKEAEEQAEEGSTCHAPVDPVA